ncbi:MAG: DNA translocase FtsK, partial [Eubacteriales bacterium]|nr:DNA translocase FtsK [Eubacteriales bacterium]
DLETDAKMEEAIKCVIDAGQASTSLLQRRLKVGYARAGRMVDDMERMGIVGPYQGAKPREVLITYQEWLERNNLTD